ncbi:MAG: hypothetical protein LBJ41_01075 [Treponema sp.]|nr:hypothetical protein [Treponema sp.]
MSLYLFLIQFDLDTMPRFIGHGEVRALLHPRFEAPRLGNYQIIHPIVHAFPQFMGDTGQLTVQRYQQMLRSRFSFA